VGWVSLQDPCIGPLDGGLWQRRGWPDDVKISQVKTETSVQSSLQKSGLGLRNVHGRGKSVSLTNTTPVNCGEGLAWTAWYCTCD